jgi:hypothetical protein
MDPTQKYYKGLDTQEPADKYGVHFEYHDLYQRLLLVKRQQDRKGNSKVFKSFDKDSRKSPVNLTGSKNRSKHSIRSNSILKNTRRGISSDFMKLMKVYSPSHKRKIETPEKFLASVKLPTSFFGRKIFKKRLNKSKVYIK